MASRGPVQFDADQRDAAASAAQQAERLMERARRGDRAAYGELVVMYQDRVFNAILRIVGEREEARELTQESFTHGLESLESFRGHSAPYTWLFRIAVNLALSRLRKVQRRRIFSLDRPGGNGQSAGSQDQAWNLVNRIQQDMPGPREALEQRERDQQVLAALGRVDPDYRAVLVMRDIEGFDYQQMADILNLALGTLKSRLFRARLALRDELKSYIEM